MPLVLDIRIGGWARDGEADDEDVALRVGQRPQPVVLLLTCCVPQVQTDDPAIHRHLNAPQTHSWVRYTVCVFVLCYSGCKNVLRSVSTQPHLREILNFLLCLIHLEALVTSQVLSIITKYNQQINYDVYYK